MNNIEIIKLIANNDKQEESKEQKKEYVKRMSGTRPVDFGKIDASSHIRKWWLVTRPQD